MSTVSIDHIAMPTANAEGLIKFYKRLGFKINDEAQAINELNKQFNSSMAEFDKIFAG